jgi:spermidine/putrescine transport system permease protein
LAKRECGVVREMSDNKFKSSVLGASENKSFAMALPAVLWQGIFLYVPVVFIIGISFLKGLDGSVFKNITLGNYDTLMNSSYFITIYRSVVLAFSTALMCLILAYPTAYFLAIKVKKYKNLLFFLLILPFWINFLVKAYSWFFILDHNGFVNSFLIKIGLISTPFHILNTPIAVYIVMVFCYLPFMILPLYNSMAKIDKFLLEASSDLGATAGQTLWHITIPLSMAGITSGFFLVLIPSFGEFVIPTLLGGGKTMYVGSMISYFFLETKNVFLGSAFTCLSGLALIFVALSIYFVFNKIGKKNMGVK